MQCFTHTYILDSYLSMSPTSVQYKVPIVHTDTRANLGSRQLTYQQLTYVFGVWKESRVPDGNPHKHREEHANFWVR